MSLYGKQFVATIVAWDTTNNVGKTGDAANITLKWVKDGVSGTTTNVCSEVSAADCPGLYKVTITAAEAQCYSGHLCGKSITSGISLIPVSYTFERLPDVDPGVNTGLAILDANLEVKASTLRTNNDKTGYSLTQLFPANFASLSISAGGLVDILQTAADKVWSSTVRSLTDKSGFALSSAGIQAIWDYTTTLLTTAGSIGKRLVDNIDATISSRLATAGYTAPDNATIGTINTKIGVPVATLSTDISNVPTNLLDLNGGVETGWTLRSLLRLQLAGICGPRSGFSTNAPVVQNPAGTKNRLSGNLITTDGDGTWTTDVT